MTTTKYPFEIKTKLMKYTTASIQTFLVQLESGNFNSMTARIADLMKREEILNTREISERTGIKESTVTARIDTLRNMGLLKPRSTRELSDGVHVTIWQWVEDWDQRNEISRQYRRGKFLRRLEGLLNPEYSEFTSPYLRSLVKREVELLTNKKQIA